jgi:hypothetical protein
MCDLDWPLVISLLAARGRRLAFNADFRPESHRDPLTNGADEPSSHRPRAVGRR